MTIPTRVPSSLSWLCATLFCLGAVSGAHAQSNDTTPEAEPSTLILSDTLHYDDVKRLSVFTGNVIMTRGLMTLHSDKLEMQEDATGNQRGVATVTPGKLVNIRQDRPETFEFIEAKGVRAEYDGKNEQIDMIGQAVLTRFICGKPFDSIRGQRVRYNQKANTYEAFGGPDSAAQGGRVRSLAMPRARTDAAIAACRAQQGKQPAATSQAGSQ